MGKILNEFRNKVPSKAKVKLLVGFKKDSNQIKLFYELKKEFNKMTKYNYANKSTIDNLFKYLKENTLSNDYNYLKHIINVLVQIYFDLENNLDSEKHELNSSYTYIMHNIELLENEIAKMLNKKDSNEIVNIVKFEKISYYILEKRDVNNSIKCINSNIDLLNYYNYEEKDFSHLLFEKYVKAKITNDFISLVYYTSIIRHIMFIYKIKFDRRKFSEIINESKNISANESKLDKKLQTFKYNSKEERFDLRKEKIVSIDVPDSKILEDALSIDNFSNEFILGIHIADVASLLNDKLICDDLPYYIRKSASLNKNEDKNAISLYVQISKDGGIVDYRILKTKINVMNNLYNYDVKEILNHKNIDDSMSKIIFDLTSLYSLVENTKLKDNPKLNYMGQAIVEKFMILFGCIIGKYFEENNLPYIYLTNKNGKVYHSLDEKNYDTGFEKYGLNIYGRSTSPIINKESRINQKLILKNISSENNSIDQTSTKTLKMYVKKLNEKI